MHIAILMSNTDRSAFADRHPKDGEKWPALLGPARPYWRFSVFDATAGVLPETLDGIDGFIVTGSPASVRSGAPWVADLLAMIRRIVAARRPIFGACFGHQAIAEALGGEVTDSPGPFVLGIVEPQIIAPLPWMAGAPRSVRVAAAHGEQVTRLPAGAQVWSVAKDCPVAGFAIGDHIYTTEYHPEITPEFLGDLVGEVAGKMPPAVIARARASLDLPMDQALLAEWIARFFEMSRADERTGQPATA